MSSTTPPTVYRRIIAARLRQLRGSRSQSEIEQACSLRGNAISRYESCDSSMSELIARTVFAYLGVEGDELDALADIARRGRRRSSSAAVHTAPDWLQQLLVLERDASQILEVALTVVPGLLQTKPYATAIVSAGSPDHVDEYVAARIERQAILDGDVQMWAVIHEGALRREVGGAEVMAEQVRHLIDMAQRSNVNLTVVPNAHGAHRGMVTSFKILGFPMEPAYRIAYTEHMTGALYVDDPAEVAEFEDAYRHVAASGLAKGQALQRLNQIAKDYEDDQST